MLLALPLLVVGFIAGAYVTQRLQSQADETKPGFVAMFDQHMIAQYADLQYREAGYEDARLALEAYIKLLETPEQSANLLANTRVRRIEALRTWSQLALLHERNGRADLADSAWQRAESLARESGWREPSRQRIRFQLENQEAREATMAKTAAPN
ncbi:MAG: hypothetical protein ACSLFQ_10845 [Thermoanaerobaculia bacterium]